MVELPRLHMVLILLAGGSQVPQERQGKARVRRVLKGGASVAHALEELLREIVTGEAGPSIRTVRCDLDLVALLEHVVKTSPIKETGA